MPDDKTDDTGSGVHTVSTVAPAAGEDDVYDAQTRVGGLSPEALAKLRELRDEEPPSSNVTGEANVPIFVDDSATPQSSDQPAIASSPEPASYAPLFAPIGPSERPGPGAPLLGIPLASLLVMGVVAVVVLAGAIIGRACSAPPVQISPPTISGP